MKILYSIFEYAIIILFLLITSTCYSQLEIKAFEQRKGKYYHYAEVEGKIYLTNDSIAVYLYEPMMQLFVVYDIHSVNNIYICKLPFSRKELKLWIWENVVFIEYKKTKTKLYLK